MILAKLRLRECSDIVSHLLPRCYGKFHQPLMKEGNGGGSEEVGEGGREGVGEGGKGRREGKEGGKEGGREGDGEKIHRAV